MKKVIYKYSISSKDSADIMSADRNGPFHVKMHKGAQIITVQAQNEAQYPNGESSMPIMGATGKIWAIVDPGQKEFEERVFRLIETGVEFDFDQSIGHRHIGTYQLYGGEIVLHLFEVTKR